MNDIGTLADNIITYDFPEDTGRFPITYVSGWVENNLGLLNGATYETFSFDETGAFVPALCPLEESIYKAIYEQEYYKRSARYALRGIVYDDVGSFKDAISMVKEGDTTIQKVSKNQIAKTFIDLADNSQECLNDLLHQYNQQKNEPLSVDGCDGNESI